MRPCEQLGDFDVSFNFLPAVPEFFLEFSHLKRIVMTGNRQKSSSESEPVETKSADAVVTEDQPKPDTEAKDKPTKEESKEETKEAEVDKDNDNDNSIQVRMRELTLIGDANYKLNLKWIDLFDIPGTCCQS